LKAQNAGTQADFSGALHPLIPHLIELIKRYKAQDISPQTLQKTLALSSQFIDVARQHPEQLIARLQCYDASLPYFVNFTFNHLVATYLVAVRNQWNDTAIQHLLCCCISQFSGIISELNSRAKDNTISLDRKRITQHNVKLLHALKKHDLEVWFTGIRYAELHWHEKPEATLNKLSLRPSTAKVLAISNCIALLMTKTRHTKACHFAQAIRLITRKLAPVDHNIIEALLKYPGLIPPGSLISLQDNRVALVLSTLCQPEQSTRYVAKTFNVKTKHCDSESFLVMPNEIKQAFAPQSVKDAACFTNAWDEEWLIFRQQHSNDEGQQLRPKLFKLDAPPPSLLAIQEHLYGNDLNTNKLTELILQEPVFALHIKNTATQSSRENIAITNVKHGLLMHGFERANSILMEHALTLRLNQHYFPSQEALLQYTTLYKYLVAAIAERKKGLTPELLSCWAGFASSGLFTLPALKTKVGLPHSAERGASLSTLLPIDSQELLPQHAAKLAQRWNQPDKLLLALRHLESAKPFSENKPYHIIGYILGLGNILTKMTYWTNYEVDEEEQSYINQASKVLGINDFNEYEIIESAIAKAHSLSPLN